jgi:hypothetical protein
MRGEGAGIKILCIGFVVGEYSHPASFSGYKLNI